MAEKPRVTIITGASAGIGRATALALSARGYPVGLVARRREMLEELAAEIQSKGGAAHAASADVGDRAAIRAAFESIANTLGPAEVLVANAGFGVRTTLDPMNIDEIETTIRVNVLGVIYSIESVLPSMLRRNSGQIVAISSLAAYKGLPGESAYCASKAAINAYMEGLRIELRKTGIKVATVCPGFVETAMNDLDATFKPFLISAEDAAGRIARVVERRRSGVVRFPWLMAWLTDLIARLPDGLVARLVGPETKG
jgi:short-subunit dehydrogenase